MNEDLGLSITGLTRAIEDSLANDSQAKLVAALHDIAAAIREVGKELRKL
jgi:hypothetical protein